MTLTLPLSIRYREEPQHKPVAWLVPGDDRRLWFEEWQRWGLPQHEWRLAFIPGWGVLTILPVSQTPQVAPRGMPLGRFGRRLYLPLHAELLPTLTVDEVEDLLSSDFVAAVFHPGRGLLVVDETDVRSVSDLLEPPILCVREWTHAEPGEALNDRLLSVQPSQELSLQQVMDAGRGDIGSQGGQLDGLPPRPAEPGTGIMDQAGRLGSRGLGFIVLQFARALGALGSQGLSGKPGGKGEKAPPDGKAGSEASSGWLQSLSDWANRQIGNVAQQLEEIRNQEIRRLMHMLANNPDEGLKYALPFGGDAYRGKGEASGRLGEREVNFNLNRLRGGGPADFWSLPADYQTQLRQRYRELANRELQLGRHRRAAYIFAELLGDHDGAASALQAGQHWREAAVLYKERLNRPLYAAQCLENGGFLHEAIALYEPLREFEKAGDIYGRLQQIEDAHRAWRAAADKYEAGCNFFGAAGIFENKLGSSAEAVEVLERSWEAGNYPQQSLEKLFALLARQAWHEQASARIRELREECRRSIEDEVVEAPAGVAALSTVARTYPERTVSHLAADSVRVIASTQLPAADAAERGRYIAALQSLVTADQLLQRDGARYLQKRQADDAARRLPTPPPRTRMRAPRLVREFRLPAETNWLNVVAQADHFFAVGNRDGRLDLRVFNWHGAGGPTTSRHLPPDMKTDPQVAADPLARGPLLICLDGGRTPRHFDVLSPELVQPVVLCENNSAGEADNAYYVGLSFAFGRAMFLERDGHSYSVVAKFRSLEAGHGLGPIQAAWEVIPHEPGNILLPTYGRNDLLAIANRSELLLVRGENDIESIEFPNHIIQIAGSAPFTRSRLAVVSWEGAAVVWPQERSPAPPPIAFAHDLNAPVVGFTGGGRLVACEANGGEIYETNNGKLALLSRMPAFVQKPLAVMPTNEPDQFAVVLRGGIVRIYKLA